MPNAQLLSFIKILLKFYVLRSGGGGGGFCWVLDTSSGAIFIFTKIQRRWPLDLAPQHIF
jgi:hypothetical protein